MVGSAKAEKTSLFSCARDVQATETASRLSQLPLEIRDDLAAFSKGEMADSGVPIRQTDAPTDAKRKLATSRFLQAILVRKTWFVSFEVSMMTPRTVGYAQTTGGGFHRIHFYNLAGPPCEAVKAALKGVTSFNSFAS